ncbi:MAG TPA: L-seryl-tRNA(Sec) selenium transferase, partial [Chloroflexia bacterium]|nr:L-seryl-tRNA(Sec) selenium transferase [Chloroflexia bacterium]
TLPTVLLALTPQPGSGSPSPARQAGEWAARLRHSPTPVIARVERGLLLVDPRTVADDEERTLLVALLSTAQGE